MASILNVDKIRATGSTTDGLTVDSTGRVLTPARPVFEVNTNGAGTTTGTANSYVKVNWGTVVTDIGSNFDSTNNDYTIPIAGAYHLNCLLLLRDIANEDDGIHAAFHVNGSLSKYLAIRNRGESATGNFGYSGFLPVFGSWTHVFNANDVVDIRFLSNGVIGVHSSGAWSQFSGFLIG